MKINTKATEMFGVNFPLIMAPMFLISDAHMVISAMQAGIIGTFPTLNYREDEKLESALVQINEASRLATSKTPIYGVNLIVQRSNPYYKRHLDICVKHKVPFYITSLGNPAEVIAAAHSYGAKVYADVTNLEHAHKVVSQGVDGIIAVGQGAGGHAGPYPLQLLIPSLKRAFPNVPVVAAGGISTGQGIMSAISLGADAVSVGTRFIACTEAPVSADYKNAIVNSHMQDIVLTERLSGTPSSIINTPYARKIGYKQGWLEKMLSTNARTKKYFKMLIQVRGMKKLEKSVKPGNYNNLWGAGQSVEFIDDIKPIAEIVKQFEEETKTAFLSFQNQFQIS